MNERKFKLVRMLLALVLVLGLSISTFSTSAFAWWNTETIQKETECTWRTNVKFDFNPKLLGNEVTVRFYNTGSRAYTLQFNSRNYTVSAHSYYTFQVRCNDIVTIKAPLFGTAYYKIDRIW